MNTPTNTGFNNNISFNNNNNSRINNRNNNRNIALGYIESTNMVDNFCGAFCKEFYELLNTFHRANNTDNINDINAAHDTLVQFTNQGIDVLKNFINNSTNYKKIVIKSINNGTHVTLVELPPQPSAPPANNYPNMLPEPSAPPANNYHSSRRNRKSRKSKK